MEKFTGRDDSPTIEEFIQIIKSKYEIFWKDMVRLNLQEEADRWWRSLGIKQLDNLSDEEFEKLFMEKQSCARKKKETKEPKGLFPTGISLLQVHGLIQKEKIIVYKSELQEKSHKCQLGKKIASPSKTY